jgi:AcrR family transcriptional regulator
MASYITERRQEEKDRRRGEIVDGAEDLYKEMGWDAVTMESVAKRARLSRALVYVYFKDKQDLHFAIAARAMEMLQKRFEEACMRSKTGLDKIVAIGRAYMAYSNEFPHYFDACARLEMHALDSADPAPQELACLEAGKHVHEVVVAALKLGQHDGTIRSDLGDLNVTARVLWGFTHGIIQIAMTKGKPLAHAGIGIPQLTQHAIHLIRGMLIGPRASD